MRFKQHSTIAADLQSRNFASENQTIQPGCGCPCFGALSLSRYLFPASQPVNRGIHSSPEASFCCCSASEMAAADGNDTDDDNDDENDEKSG